MLPVTFWKPLLIESTSTSRSINILETIDSMSSRERPGCGDPDAVDLKPESEPVSPHSRVLWMSSNTVLPGPT